MIDLIISPCSQLVTMAGPRGPRRGASMRELGLIENGALGINVGNGTVEYAGPAEKLGGPGVLPSCPVINASGCVVTPGLIDSHTHLVWAGSRCGEFFRRSSGESYADIAKAGGGIMSTVEATRKTTENELFDSAARRLLQLYANGTTTVEIKSGYGLERDSELRMLRVVRRLRDSHPGLIFPTFMAAHALPPEHSTRRWAYIELVCSLLKEVDELGLADFYDIFVDPLAFTQEEAEQVIAAAKGSTLGLHLHGDEFGDDGTAAWATRVGAVSVDHLGGISEAGIAALAGSDTVATLLPGTMFYSAHGKYAPARRMIDAGCAVALATDLNPGSSQVYSLAFVMALAALNMQMSIEECLSATTVNAAHALGIADMAGELSTGMRADIAIWEVADYHDIPCHIGADIVRDVFIRGRIVKRQHRMVLGAQ